MNKQQYIKQLINGRSSFNTSKTKQSATPDKYPQGYFKAKQCRKCSKVFVPKAPSEQYCSDDCKDYALVERYYIRVYGLTLEEYATLAAKQSYRCAICGEENFAMGEAHSGCLVVDHDHVTGKVRGLLCHNCNRALGLLHDDIERLEHCITYLKCNDYPEREYSQAAGSGEDSSES